MMAVTSHSVALLSHSTGWVRGPVWLVQNKQTPWKQHNNSRQIGKQLRLINKPEPR